MESSINKPLASPQTVSITSSASILRTFESTSLINLLPTELLVKILQITVDLTPVVSLYGWTRNSSRYDPILRLSHVCSWWHHIFESSPEFWTTVRSDINEDGLREVLRRSKPRLIDAEYEQAYHSNDLLVVVDLCAFLVAIEQDVGRCSSISIEFPSEEEGLDDSDWASVLQLPAPHLERLDLYQQVEFYDEVDLSHIKLFGGVCDKLRDVYLRGVACDFSQGAFKMLERLHLASIAFTDLAEIVDIIRESPQLQKLELHRCDLVEEQEGPIQPATLNHLQLFDVEFEGGSQDAVKWFKDHIRFPPSCSVIVSLYDVAEGEEKEFLEVPFGEWLQERHSEMGSHQLESVELHFDGDTEHGIWLFEFTLSFGTSSVQGGVRGLKATDASTSLALVVESIQSYHHAEALFTTLKFSKDGANPLTSPDARSILGKLPNMTRLEFFDPYFRVPKNSNTTVLNICDFFSSAISDEQHILHNIRHLTFHTVPGWMVTKSISIVFGDLEGHAGDDLGAFIQSLDCLEIHISPENAKFAKMDAAAAEWRNNPKIGKVDIYYML